MLYLTLVIGRRSNVDEDRWRQMIENERPMVDIVGFDELLDRARTLAGVLDWYKRTRATSGS